MCTVSDIHWQRLSAECDCNARLFCLDLSDAALLPGAARPCRLHAEGIVSDPVESGYQHPNGSVKSCRAGGTSTALGDHIATTSFARVGDLHQPPAAPMHELLRGRGQCTLPAAVRWARCAASLALARTPTHLGPTSAYGSGAKSGPVDETDALRGGFDRLRRKMRSYLALAEICSCVRFWSCAQCGILLQTTIHGSGVVFRVVQGG